MHCTSRMAALGAAFALLTGCHDIKEKLHLLPNQDEQSCLDSEKLKFKDPAVEFVANLGDRGWKLDAQTQRYWVRYKAKNEYAAYVQGNMLCKFDGKKWVRDTPEEFLMQVRVATRLIERDVARMRAGGKSDGGLFPKGSDPESFAFKLAADILYESPDALDAYVTE